MKTERTIGLTVTPHLADRTPPRQSFLLNGLCLLAAGLVITQQSPTIVALVTGVTAAAAALTGRPPVLLFVFGLSLTLGASRSSGVPLILAVPIFSLAGTWVRALFLSSSFRHLPLLAVAVGITLYQYASPPMTKASTVSSW